MNAWPQTLDERRALVSEVENELVFGQTSYRFVRLDRAGKADGRAPAVVQAERGFFASCENAQSPLEPLDATLTPRAVAKLHRALTRRVRELIACGKLPRAWTDPCQLAWPELLRAIIACIAAGASDPTSLRRGIATLPLRLVREVRYIIADFYPKTALARRMLRPADPPRVCRHHAMALPLIFAAVLRDAGRDEPVFALHVTGRPYSSSKWDHSWNWFVDVARAQIVAIDLSTALASRPREGDVFSNPLDWMEMSNVSAFLHTLFVHAGSSTVPPPFETRCPS